MALQELNPEAVQPTVQALLSFLDREEISIPGNMVESIVSGKSLLRALLNGQLVLAQKSQEPPKAPAAPEPAAEEPAATKKTTKKKAA